MPNVGTKRRKIGDSQAMRLATIQYLSTIDRDCPPEPHIMEQELLALTEEYFEKENALLTGNAKLAIPRHLSVSQIVDIVLHLYDIRKIDLTYDGKGGHNLDSDYAVLAIYQNEGDNRGLYVQDEGLLRDLAEQYNYNATLRDLQEFLVKLKDAAPWADRCMDKDLIAVNNGIFNYRTKELIPFSPDMVFLSKSRVDYVPNAINPVIHNATDGTDWDIESWMQSLSDDSDIIDLLWEIAGAVIRPNVRWDKAVFFYSELGNNGKGTFCEMLRNLCGRESCASLSIDAFSKEFYLSDLIGKSAVITDENKVGVYVDGVDGFKSAVTGDVLQINRKYKSTVNYRFRGLIIECINGLPRVKDRSDSFYRRMLFVPFDKHFEGRERKYIKAEYLSRQDVLEYALWRVLNTDYYNFSLPAACTQALEQYKEFNDPLRSFLMDILPRLAWSAVPASFLYDLYRAWYRQNSPGGGELGRNTFLRSAAGLIEEMPGWTSKGILRDDKMRVPQGAMDDPEPMILEYSLSNWFNQSYKGHNALRTANPAAPSGATRLFMKS